jgi:hypothetical protein
MKTSPDGHCSKKIIALAAVDAGGKTRTVQLENNVVRSNNTKSKKKEDTNITHGMQDPIFIFANQQNHIESMEVIALPHSFDY